MFTKTRQYKGFRCLENLYFDQIFRLKLFKTRKATIFSLQTLWASHK